MVASKTLAFAVRSWATANLLREDAESEEEIVDSYRNVRNWRRYNRVVTIGPEDDRGCKRVTIEWDEDYEYEIVIVIERRPRIGFGWGGGFQLGGRTTHRIGWFEVKGEHHRESGIECPGDTMLASLKEEQDHAVSVNDETIWSGNESPYVTVVTGGMVAPILGGCEGHLERFIEWMENTA